MNNKGGEDELAELKLEVSELKQRLTWQERVNAQQVEKIDGLLDRVARMVGYEEAEQPPQKRRHLWLVPPAAIVSFAVVAWRKLAMPVKGAVAVSTAVAVGGGTAGLIYVHSGSQDKPGGRAGTFQPRPSLSYNFAAHRRRRRLGAPSHPGETKQAMHGDVDHDSPVRPMGIVTFPGSVVPSSPSPARTPAPSPDPIPLPIPVPTKTHPPHPGHTCLKLPLLNLCA